MSGEKNNKSESSNEQPKEKLRCDEEQYKLLRECSKKKDMTEWNEWRKEHKDEDILLEGADLLRFYLKGVLLSTGVDSGFSGDVHLESANLSFAQVEGGDFQGAHLENTDLVEALLKGANLRWAHLERANLFKSHLKGADLRSVHLEGAQLQGINLEDAILTNAHLEGVDLYRARLGGTKLQIATVDGFTLFLECQVDRHTDLRNVGLDYARIEPGTKQLLKYNIRRMNWEDWYKEHWFWRWPFRLFWFLSDYGMSGKRVVGIFFLLAFLFAGIYSNCAYWRPPGIVSNLEVQPEIGEAAWHYFLRAPVRAVYFSIVTMTTLGFGDMYANKGSIAGHVILAVQVILGYVLLGALITRFAVLFTAGGPAGKFAESGKGPG